MVSRDTRSDHLLRFRADKTSLGPEVLELINGFYYTAEVRIVPLSFKEELARPALYRVIGDGGLFECYLNSFKILCYQSAIEKSYGRIPFDARTSELLVSGG